MCSIYNRETVWTGKNWKTHPGLLRGHSLYIIFNEQATVAPIKYLYKFNGGLKYSLHSLADRQSASIL